MHIMKMSSDVLKLHSPFWAEKLPNCLFLQFDSVFMV